MPCCAAPRRAVLPHASCPTDAVLCCAVCRCAVCHGAWLQGKVRDVKYDFESCRLAALSTDGCVKLLDAARNLRTTRTVRQGGCGRGGRLGSGCRAAQLKLEPGLRPPPCGKHTQRYICHATYIYMYMHV